MKTVYQTDANGYFVGPTFADESPLEPGVYLIPGGAVEAEPPSIPDGSRARWDGGSWQLEAIPEPEPQPEPEPEPALRIVAMWRARTIMKVTLWGEGMLFDAVQAAIAGLTDPLQKAAAEEALERGTDFDRDGVFVPMLAQMVGITDEQLDEMMAQAAALPA
ncbi:hypothetical protein [Microvirga sp. TS319]|uniref:hypothetical protein n=1 Tax=Microvirga sp. TS319 TaxID=3241165 RepID=UPI003519E048